ncbi:OsmC family protein [Mucilaginibacter endophyticus]|uniref:OsmC family protein n=1 Tax=Mucilaginibacter endophyticus TaxID=2675003 RepID=UPI000E0DC854|nr:OsmC family protein [Mucilaginibacter endophyticus]
MLNGINLDGLAAYTQIITRNPAEAISSYGITANWLGGVSTEIRTESQKVGSAEISKDFSFKIDEPQELLGNNQAPTPQDYLFAGLAGCMMVGFVVGASQKDIKLESVVLTIKGNLNLLGFLGIDPNAPVGFERIEFHYDVKGNGTKDDYDEIIRKVQQTSPNYRTLVDSVILTTSKC